MTSSSEDSGAGRRPTVTVVFLAYNRCDDVRLSLTKTLGELAYDRDLLDVIVVDNASSDGTAEMVATEFPGVRVIRRSWNCGVSGWNDGFAAATGDYVLALDDDCHLPPDGLRRAVAEAERHGADLVSFAVTSAQEGTHRFDLDEYLTGLFTFWGCAVLMRREILETLHGYDPEIFVWANELEFMLRFFDRGYRHLHLPQVVAVHAKEPGLFLERMPERPYRMNARNWAYIAAKLLRPRDAVEAIVAQLVRTVRDGFREDRLALKALPDVFRGSAHGLRHRRPVRAEVSRTYRHNCETFASPWWISRTPLSAIRGALLPGRAPTDQRSRREKWLIERADFYPGGWTLADHGRRDMRRREGQERIGVLQL